MKKRMTDYKYIKNIVAGMLVISMVFVDLPLALKVYRSNDTGNGDERIEYENHDMETYFADGNYNGSDSFWEKTSDDSDTINTNETLYHYNILEIVRGEGMGTIGYLIDGLEPVPGDTPEMRHAAMDALMNTVNGRSWLGEKPNAVRNFEAKLSYDKMPFEVQSSSNGYTGYYKYVGPDKGFYYVDDSTYDEGSHSVIAESKFYNYSNNTYSGKSYDYIWVDADGTAQQLIDSDVTDDDKDYVVEHHRKYKYVNKNTFFGTLYTPQEYDANANDKYKSSTVDEWKKNHKVQLKTVPCGQLKDEDIEWADLIIISNGDGDQVTEAYNIYKYSHPQEAKNGLLPDKNSLPKFEIKTFRQALLIYDRIAAREDASVVFDVKNITGGTSEINNNLRKLIAMLFRMDKIINNTTVRCAGRDMFMDYLPFYVDAWKAPGQRTDGVSNAFNGLKEMNGYMYQDFPRTQVSASYSGDSDVDSTNYYYDINGKVVEKTAYFRRGKSNTTDYIYIDDEGRFRVIADEYSYSGKVYWVDYDAYGSQSGFAYRYVSWVKNLAQLNKSQTWPWQLSGSDGDGYLKYWWFSKEVTDQHVHIPIYFMYYGWGGYRAFNSSGDNLEGAYKNQSFSYENVLYQNDNMKKAINGREVKREYTDPTHSEQIPTPHHYFLSVNIENGDGVNKTIGGNKVLYVNDYEMTGSNAITELPIRFTVRTSENIHKIELVKKKGSIETVIQQYNPVSSNDITIPEADQTLKCSGRPDLVMRNETVYEGTGDSRKPTKDIAHNNLYIYSFADYDRVGTDGAENISMKIKADDFKSGSNNKFLLRVYVRDDKYVEDEIIVVKRGFFMLE